MRGAHSTTEHAQQRAQGQQHIRDGDGATHDQGAARVTERGARHDREDHRAERAEGEGMQPLGREARTPTTRTPSMRARSAPTHRRHAGPTGSARRAHGNSPAGEPHDVSPAVNAARGRKDGFGPEDVREGDEHRAADGGLFHPGPRYRRW